MFRLLLFVSACVGILGFSSTQAEEQQRPNILLILVDDLNLYLGTFGHPNALSPNMDRLAESGVLFTNAHCQAPICGPARAAMMTGLRPSTTGIYGMIEDDEIQLASPVTQDVIHLPEYLKKFGGYTTLAVGKVYHKSVPMGMFDENGGRVPGFGPKPEDGSYFEWRGEGTSTDWGVFPKRDEQMPDFDTASWAIEHLEEDFESPFFMAVGFLRPHVPWYVPQRWFDLYEQERIVTPPYREDDGDDLPAITREMDHLPMMPTTEWAIETGKWKAIVEGYLASVSFVDYQIGRVLDALESSAYRDNTYVILASDHGYRLGEKGTFAKHCLWRGGTQVPLMIAGPSVPSSIRQHEAAELLDIYPTILELAGLPAYERNQGESLVPLFDGRPSELRRYAITTYGRNNHSVVDRNFRYIQYEDGSEELYDHWKDPNEFHNVADDPRYQIDKKRLHKQLPKDNVLWSPYSMYDYNEYFANQRREQTQE